MVLDLGIGEELKIIEHNKYPKKLQSILKFTFLYSLILQGLLVATSYFVRSPFVPYVFGVLQPKADVAEEYSQFQSILGSSDSSFILSLFIIMKIVVAFYIFLNLTILFYLTSKYVQRYTPLKHGNERILIEDNGSHSPHFLYENFSLSTVLNFRRNGIAFYQLLVLCYFAAFYVVLLLLIFLFHLNSSIIGIFILTTAGIIVAILKKYGQNFSLHNITPIINFPFVIALDFIIYHIVVSGTVFDIKDGDFIFKSFQTFPLFVIVAGATLLRFKQDTYFFINTSDATRWTHQ